MIRNVNDVNINVPVIVAKYQSLNFAYSSIQQDFVAIKIC